MNLTSKFLSNKAWNKYKKIIKDFIDKDAGRQVVTWMRHIDQIGAFGEDWGDQYLPVQLEALCYYNVFRNWPINKPTISGELDEENLTIYVTKRQIETLGYINSEGYWQLNWSEDRFVINGITYKPSGDTQVAQAKDEALCFIVILKRDRDTQL